MESLLEIRNLVIEFDTPDGIIHAVNGVSFAIPKGQTLGIVGESGCGKSVTMLSVMRLIQQPPGRIVDGEIIYKDKDILSVEDSEIQKIRGAEIGMVFQDPLTSLDPLFTIGHQISEAQIHHLGVNREEAFKRSIELLELVGIPQAQERYNDYPHQFSGGMRQRVLIATALACSPSILIADEPTTALDVTIQAQILELIKKIQQQMGMSVVWITHDLGVVAELADRVVVMYAGQIVEEADVFQIFKRPQHPYTIALLRSLPRADHTSGERLESIPGAPPDGFQVPVGCAFLPRCAFAREICAIKGPELLSISADHKVACWVDIRTRNER